ncbi:FecR family protein [Mucilaginibacter agri]|uniref:DUF4974 domain-containing protein n=1 Tax=Mucilaginibacter agri TaxID=2695265 RepID=A0A965ZGI8_9SPHI|nr:FecR domain-containing protein [Mucilaginibacter agri]NCD69584.1 DUF4974 domain-containing protein [Mucilaginibacter agri]
MNSPDNHITDDLLVKYLAGEASPEEATNAELWINASETNKKYYTHFKLIWDESEGVGANRNVDENAAWARLQSRMAIAHGNHKPKSKIKNRWIQLAASIVLVCLIGYIMRNQSESNKMISRSSGVNVVDEHLSDGSVVTLNSNSELSYPSRFKGNERPVKLSGEAFFKIAPDKTKPFIISIKNVTVRVVGTSFDVKNSKGKTEVTVETGIVKVSAHGQEVLLHPGEKVIADEAGTQLLKNESKGKLYNYYITKELVCDNTPLHELVDKLNEVYNAQIKIANPKLNNLPITVVFKQQPLDQVLKVIAETFNVQVAHEGNTILLK